MTAETIAEALDGHKCGVGWIARCPSHEDQTPSLSNRDTNGGNVVRCHAGCEQEQVIAALRSRGRWLGRSSCWFTPCASRAVSNNRAGRDDPKRTEAALAIWQSSPPAGGTLGTANDEQHAVASENEDARQP